MAGVVKNRGRNQTDDSFFKIDGIKDMNELESAMDKILTYFDEQKSKTDNNRIFEGILFFASRKCRKL
ncbi:hypothetical protein ABEV09_10440 [Schinkia azotoformans]|uniref:hypothetical protein n=1 Tax=Schinkia azotoformans TaxID=1454 RepID=UPI002DBC09D1|nr:hypothetical protein [Schinkia azotoformans]MEC1715438.1 hypothetical protein [Schinkia azotoformans]